MRDFKDIKVAIAGTGYVGLTEHSYIVISTSSCNSSRCNSGKGGKTK